MSAEIVVLEDPQSGAAAQVLISQGFNCFSWKAPFAASEEPRELLWAEDGYEQGDKSPFVSGIPLLFPFPGRIRGESFDFNGNSYPLEAGDGLGNALHGYLCATKWRKVDSTPSSVTAEMQASIDAPTKLNMWTGDYRVRAKYTLSGSRLEFDIEFENLSSEPLPWGFGTHAYFKLPLADGSDPEQTKLKVPVVALWRKENPLPTGDLDPLGDYEDLIEGGPLAQREYDTPFRMKTEPTQTTEVIDPATGRTVRQTFDSSMTTCVIYTPPHREAVCLEPYTCVPNPFELEESGIETGLRVLAPGESASTRTVLEALMSND